MASWAALNADAPRASQEDTRDLATEEAQEARNATLYEQALRLQQQQKMDDARAIYSQLLEASSGLSGRLRYLCAKNLATLEADGRALDAALRHFSEALALDATDVVVWFQMGKTAMETGQLWLARQALEAGFQVDATFWPLVHLLCDVLHAVGDAAAYKQVALFLLERDPNAGGSNAPLPVMDGHVDPEFRVCQAKPLDAAVVNPLKRSTRALEALEEAAKKRHALESEVRHKRDVEVSRTPLQYVLQQNSWHGLGKLLLQAYEDVAGETSNAEATRRVCIAVEFAEEELQLSPTSTGDAAVAPAGSVETISGGDDPQLPTETDAATLDMTADAEVEEIKPTDGTAAEPIDVDQAGDGDQDAAAGDNDAPQTHRRKSRRHEEKLREEHEIAVKLAREKDLAYRLQAFVPPSPTKSDNEETGLRGIIFRVQGASVLLEDSNGLVVHTFDDVLPNEPAAEDGADPVSQGGGEPTSARDAAATSQPVERQLISEFVGATMDNAQGVNITSLLRRYLNQCGAWAHRPLKPVVTEASDFIHPVCLWAEKIVHGSLSMKLPTSADREAEQRSQILSGCPPSDGLTISTRLFLLELRLDDLLQQQPQQGPARSRRAVRSHTGRLDAVLREAQALLLDICCSEMDGASGDTEHGLSRSLARLFWLCGQICERRGNADSAKEYFRKCKGALEELEQPAELSLPNLYVPVQVSMSMVEQKITGLQYTEVCTEAQEMTTTAKFDEAQGRLLRHFFPTKGQPGRIDDLLEDLASAKERGQDPADGETQEGESSRSVLELLLESVDQSACSSHSDKILILLVLLSKFLDAMKATRNKIVAKKANVDASKHKLTLVIQAIELTVDKLAAVISAGADSDVAVSLSSFAKQAVIAVARRLLDPPILLLFDSPRDVLYVIQDMDEQLLSGDISDDPKLAARVRGPLLVATLKSFRAMRSMPVSDLQALMGVLAAGGRAKAKKKQPFRQDRVRSFVQSALTLLAAHVQELVNAVPFAQVRGLMEDCCTLLKQEEATAGRRNEIDKKSRKILSVGAVLFLQLAANMHAHKDDKESALKDLVALIGLLHERLGQHELCTQKCFDKSIESGRCDGESFVEVAASILGKRRADHEMVQQARRRAKKVSTKKRPREDNSSDNEGNESADEEGTGEDDDGGGDDFDSTLAQCYRCLYDIHVVPGCEDHKSGASIADLDNASSERAQELAQFAIPMMLNRPPRSNAQKKENLKILLAIRRTIDLSEEAYQPPVQPEEPVQEYLSPKGLLSWTADVPVASLPSVATADSDCLEHLWFLLGENFILLRVRRRSNLSELMEMERKIKERVAFLLKDTQYYRPRRIKSWVRLGRAMKELYQVASDACALVLGRKWRKRPYLATNDDATSRRQLSFEDAVLKVSLFERMKEWNDLSDFERQAAFRVEFEARRVERAGDDDASVFVEPTRLCIEEAASNYMDQVVEFSRRCYDMAAALAVPHPSRGGDGDGDQIMVDEGASKLRDIADSIDPGSLVDIAVECHEECGLLMYNQLQELAMLRHDDSATEPGFFPAAFYEKILSATLYYFHEGLRISKQNCPAAHDVRFRFQYMLGKALKKRLWFQTITTSIPAEVIVNSDDVKSEIVPQEPVTTAAAILECFASAEQDHEDGKMDKSIVQAFYQLQAMRLQLVLAEPVTVDNLTLVCSHFFEEDAGDVEEDEDMEDADKAEEEKDEAVVKVRKDDVAAILTLANADSGTDKLHLARGWLFFNVVDALESISDEDRYFHPSRYALAKAMYHYNDIVGQLESIHNDSSPPLASSPTSASTCIAVLAAKKAKKKNGGATPAEIALKELNSLFDKRRPQVVAIWLSEHVPESKKFEELNQRQIKFDFCRLKYFKYLVALLQESQAYARLKEIGSWVLACKEEHDAIDELLGMALHARGVVQLSRLRDYVSVDLVDQLQLYQRKRQEMRQGAEAHSGDEGCADGVNEADVPGVDPPSDGLLKELSKAYVNFLDVSDSRTRLARVMDATAFQETVLLAEFPVVCLFLVGATEFPRTFEVPERDNVLTASYVAEITPKLRAMLLNDLSLAACASVDWKPLLQGARIFCEDRWPERHGGKAASGNKTATSRKARHVKAATAAPAPTPVTTESSGPAEETKGPASDGSTSAAAASTEMMPAEI